METTPESWEALLGPLARILANWVIKKVKQKWRKKYPGKRKRKKA